MFIQRMGSLSNLALVPDKLPSQSIAEQNLNYEIMPSEHLQNKVDFFITPYNK
jgi:hypothetical protein